jgi:hypothetical protein
VDSPHVSQTQKSVRPPLEIQMGATRAQAKDRVVLLTRSLMLKEELLRAPHPPPFRGELVRLLTVMRGDLWSANVSRA